MSVLNTFSDEKSSRIFQPFNVLIPKKEYLDCWPVIACDQFTSQSEYWDQLEALVGNSPSALRCILPEARLSSATEETYGEIRKAMQEYLNAGLFDEFGGAFVYVERTLLGGEIRRGIVGVVDLEAYDYHSDAKAAIRATERTVVERIPPRMKVRRGALLELSHVLLLCDDEQFSIIEPIRGEEEKKLYDLDLLQGGGHISGWLIDGEAAENLLKRLDAYCSRKAEPLDGMAFVVGDGNHSLATAKECYEELKKTSQDEAAIQCARYAMVELENIHDRAQKFEPIHRLLRKVDVGKLLAFLEKECCCEAAGLETNEDCSDDAPNAEKGYPIAWVSGEREGILYLDKKKGVLPVGILQAALDVYLKKEEGEIDYIHGEDTLRELSRGENTARAGLSGAAEGRPAEAGTIGFVLPAIPKDDFFNGIAKDGVLPRKTFSMGEAKEKRYYLEARRL
ncbi:MAG: DUF1015 domain-containing protein [Lachnospiraceae bacterium]|nr:DUF1015 domain-containing protein [Lachnospiraceae bacterium]